MAIASHAFSTCYGLDEVRLPSSVVEVGSFAFMNTALQAFEAPRDLRVIGEKAFFKCKKLRDVALNDGLSAIGEGAFKESGLRRLGGWRHALPAPGQRHLLRNPLR